MPEIIFYLVCIASTCAWITNGIKKYVYEYQIPETVEYF